MDLVNHDTPNNYTLRTIITVLLNVPLTALPDWSDVMSNSQSTMKAASQTGKDTELHWGAEQSFELQWRQQIIAEFHNLIDYFMDDKSVQFLTENAKSHSLQDLLQQRRKRKSPLLFFFKDPVSQFCKHSAHLSRLFTATVLKFKELLL